MKRPGQEEEGGGDGRQANGPPLRLYDPGFKSKAKIYPVLISLDTGLTSSLFSLQPHMPAGN
jgi:hypothetical protein